MDAHKNHRGGLKSLPNRNDYEWKKADIMDRGKTAGVLPSLSADIKLF
jgi:hypothetical protein